MAKSDSFFIRASVTPDDSGTFVQTTVDLGAFVEKESCKMVHILEHPFQLFLALKRVRKQMEPLLVEILFRKLLLSFFRYSDSE